MEHEFVEPHDESASLMGNGQMPDGNFEQLLDAIANGAGPDDEPHRSLFQSSSSTWDVNSTIVHRNPKRKRTESDVGDALPKLRRIIQEQVLGNGDLDVANRNSNSMTTITGYHASAAQKSYGLEKRFLCPPPLIRITGPLAEKAKSQELTMSVIAENGAKLQEQTSSFDQEHGIVAFKQLHINSQGKDKSFQLVLGIKDNRPPEAINPTSALTRPAAKEPWAVFSSNPVHIISKPSKKTTRGNTPGIMNMGQIALFNRINSQTVRTKYLSHKGQEGFTTGSSHWSPFQVVEIVNGQESTQLGSIVYGSRVILKAPGFRSHEYIIRKVEKHRSLSTDFGRQVSQMQKIALLRADIAPVDGKVCYLSALVERPGNEPITVVPGSTNSTSWRYSEVHTEAQEDGSTTEFHDVNDYATWMITSISAFQCSFFDASGSNTCPPRMPLTPTPSTHYCRWVPPAQKGGLHSLEMSVAWFYSFNQAAGTKEALEVWVGDIGPLSVAAYEGVAAQTTPNMMSAHMGVDGMLAFNPNAAHGGGLATLAGQPISAFVAVSLPSMPELLKALANSVRTSRHSSGPRARSNTQERNGLDHEGDGEPDEVVFSRNPTLPILFLRRRDNVGFHSGYVLYCVPAIGDNLDNIEGWSVRVEKTEVL